MANLPLAIVNFKPCRSIADSVCHASPIFSSPGRSPGRAIVLPSASALALASALAAVSALAKSLMLKFFSSPEPKAPGELIV